MYDEFEKSHEVILRACDIYDKMIIDGLKSEIAKIAIEDEKMAWVLNSIADKIYRVIDDIRGCVTDI